MAATYYQSGDNAAPTGGSLFSKRIVPSGGTTSASLTLGGNTGTGSFFTDPDEPGNRGATGDFTVTASIGSAASNRSLSVRLHRVSSSGAIQASGTASAAQSCGSVGVLTFSFTSVNLGSWAVGDRLRVDFIIAQTAGGGASLTILVGEGGGRRIDTPFSTSITHVMAADAGGHSLSGSAMVPRKALKIAAAGGAHAFSGAAATLRRGFAIGAAAGSHALFGIGAIFQKALNVGAAAGNYGVGGATARLLAAYKMAVGPGDYLLDGTDPDFEPDLRTFTDDGPDPARILTLPAAHRLLIVRSGSARNASAGKAQIRSTILMPLRRGRQA